MNYEMVNDFTNKVLSDACDKFGINVKNLKLLANKNSFVYEYVSTEKSFILRLVHNSHRKRKLVEGELGWINYLVHKGVNTASPLCSKNGKLVEVVKGKNGYYSVSAFKKVNGEKPKEIHWNADFFRKMGELLGKMHSLSTKYKPKNIETRRLNWYENYYYDFDKYIPSNEVVILQKSKNLLKKIYSLPTNNKSYGLIHLDFNIWNIFVYKSNITVFDFDDCEYNWFINDIAIALYHFYDISFNKLDKDYFPYYFLENLMKGYNMENKIEPYWFKQINDFIRLRDVLIYLGNISNRDKFKLNQYKYRIENEIPRVDVDFNRLMKIL